MAHSSTPRDSGRLRADDGAELHYEIRGDGSETAIVPAAVFLGPAFDPILSGRTFIFYDPRGRGRSEPIDDPERLGLDLEVRDLEAVRRHFGLRSPTLIGFSYLGAVVALHGIRHPGRAGRIVQMGPMPPRSAAPYLEGRPGPGDLLDGDDLERLQRLKEAGVPESDPARYCHAYWRTHLPMYTAPEAPVDRLLSELDLGCDLPNEQPAAFTRTLQGVFAENPSWDWRRDAEGISVPTLVLHGESDRVAPPGGGREWARVTPNARLLVIPKAGHLLWAEQPASVLAAIDTFLDGRWPADATPLG